MSLDLNTYKKHKTIPPVATSKSGFRYAFEKLSNLGKHDIKIFKGPKDKQKERFFTEIGMLLSAGVDLQTVLKLSCKGKKNNKLADIYNMILEQIMLGRGLAKAMENTGEFSNFDCYSVLIGENTGELAKVFDKLSLFYNKKITQKRKITGALSYPLIVLITTIGAVYFMLKFVVPMFSDTLTKFGGELPPLTKFIITVSNHITTFFFAIIFILSTLLYLYKKNKHKEIVKKTLSSFILSIPYISKVIYKTYLLQFTQAMDLLLTAKVNVVQSIELTQKMIQFYPLTSALKKIKEEMMNGEFFHKSIEKQTFFDNSMITLVKIGEEVNQLDKIFMQLSKQYENELEYQSNLLITVLEPIILLILAFTVAIILIAMYLPMFKIGTVVH